VFKQTIDPTVAWIAGCVPETEEAGIVHDVITVQGIRTRHAIARAVAEELFRRDRRRAGAEGGIGLFRAWYEAGAERLLDRLDGRLITIEQRP
jgi:hypothetical protein